ncbi:MAG: T9SS type A sorting domain-containing protein, partial [Ignavibacteria bacterium]|nr:T9SS type A sorting domain-containing protein [Ignavibacteria bacterium]
VAGTSAGVYASTNSGVNWISKNEGLQFLNVKKLHEYNDFIFAATDGNGIYKRPKSEVISVQNVSVITPQNFNLYQNYPNPFNPNTIISFDIPNSSPLSPLQRGTMFVTLKIFDITGKEVETLVNEQLSPGSYEVDWNASRYPSGTYFYRLETKDFRETKKMVLIK